MNIVRKKEALVLFIGDLAVLFISLYVTITIRYGSIPTQEMLLQHIAPFTILFLVSILVHFIAGLYEKHTLLFKRKLPKILTQVQVVNAIISIAFFYFVPNFDIAPKLILFLYLIISLVIMVAWRMAIAETFGSGRKNRALLLASGSEAYELHEEINHNPRYGTAFVEWIDISSTSISSDGILGLIKSNEITLIVADFSNQKIHELMPTLYSLIFTGVQFADIQKVYEDIFDRVPLSLVNDNWFLENVSTSNKGVFDICKRIMDIIVSAVTGVISIVVYPFIYLAIKLDDGGVLFSYQNRIGQNNKIIRIVKFRTMQIANDEGKWGKQENKVTRVGNFLRKTRFDELPQLWNVFRGDVSLVGPRPEFSNAVSSYSEVIPYYNVRHIVKPGLSGWAQIYGMHPHHGINAEETSNKLSYDLYYIKNRSLLLDLKIALQTLKVLISFVGR